MNEPDYKEFLYKLKPTNKELWSGAIFVAILGIILVLSFFEIFGSKSEILAILSGLFTAHWSGRLAEIASVRRRIGNALKEKMAT